jgi:enterochelin esterase-like enzyme
MQRWASFDAFINDARNAETADERRALVDALLKERQQWPWIEEDRATFIYHRPETESVALNLDTVPTDPPFLPFERLYGTDFFHVTHHFESDALLDYLLAVDDPMTPLATEPDIARRIAAYWQPDPRNPLRMEAGGVNVSVLRMNNARPFPDWSSFRGVRHGQVHEHVLDSDEIGFTGRRLWVYTPPGYEQGGMAYPLLILQDGQWANGPLQVPYIADALIKNGRMQSAVIAMMQSGTQEERNREYITNDRYYAFVLRELMPTVQTSYRIDSSKVAIGGVAVGAIAAAHAALQNPAVFSGLMMVSPPLGKGQSQDQLRDLVRRFEGSERLPSRIFQSVGRYEARARFIRPAHSLRDQMLNRRGIAYKFAETGSGHGLVGFRSVMPEALAWMFPGAAFTR